MPRYIDADKYCDFLNKYPLEKAQSNFMTFYRDALQYTFECEVDVEPTEEQVREYCHKRCLTLVTAELFNEMKARWSAEPVRHGQWVENNGRYGWYCSQCKKENNYAYDYNENNVIELQDHYCPNCGAKMDEETEDDTDE